MVLGNNDAEQDAGYTALGLNNSFGHNTSTKQGAWSTEQGI